MKEVVTLVAIVLSMISFYLYVDDANRKARLSESDLIQVPKRKAEAIAVPSAQEMADFVKAMAKLVKALSAAGPGLTALIGSIIFLAIAAASTLTIGK
ncbi:MAG TPA: hypothetical protein VH414_16240 [Lichenihabitans sp.]|jgi:hypothetical protein|nr:hypothetical protein [Lichenihabitans sp.]